MMTRTIEDKNNPSGKYQLVCVQRDELENYKHLAYDLAAHYIGKAPSVTRIVRQQNYSGTQTYTVTYSNGVRSIYRGNIY